MSQRLPDDWYIEASGELLILDQNKVADEIKKYRAALKPFAAMAEHYPTKGGYGNRPSNGVLWQTSSGGKPDAEITVEDLHTARHTLGE